MAKDDNKEEKKHSNLTEKALMDELVSIHESIKEQQKVVKEIEEKIQNQDKTIEKLKKHNTFKWVFSSGVFVLIALVFIFNFIIPSHKFRQDLNKVDVGILRKIEMMDSIYFVNVNRDITSQLEAFNTLSSQDKYELQKNLNSRIEKRNEIFAREIEKANNSLMNNVVIINLIGRYTVIISCIISFVLVLRAFAGSKRKDDIFE